MSKNREMIPEYTNKRATDQPKGLKMEKNKYQSMYIIDSLLAESWPCVWYKPCISSIYTYSF